MCPRNCAPYLRGIKNTILVKTNSQNKHPLELCTHQFPL